MSKCGEVKKPEGWVCMVEGMHTHHLARVGAVIEPWLNEDNRFAVQEANKVTLGTIIEGAEPPSTAEFNNAHVQPSFEPHAFLRRDPQFTSVAAAASVLPRTGTKRRQVYDALVAAGASGLTDDEMQDLLAMNPSTQRPRRIELVQQGFVRESGRTRPTVSGEQAIVWVVANQS